MNLLGRLAEKGLLAAHVQHWQDVAYRVYLAGRMTGLPEYGFPVFRHYAAELREAGYEVVSPHEMDEAIDGFDPATDQAKPMRHYMSRDLPAVLSCNGIAMIPGWEESKGATLEHHVATTCGLPAYCAHLLAAGATLVEALLEQPSDQETILEEAQRLVYGDRAKAYGHPRLHFRRTIGSLNALGFRRLTPDDSGIRELVEQDWPDILITDKMARRANSPEKRDHLTDIAGYAATAERLSEPEDGLRADSGLEAPENGLQPRPPCE